MRSSHPPTLLTLTQRLAVREHLLEPNSHVLVAVSGGPDSIALLHVLARLQGKFGYTLTAHGVDHGLREEAGAELDLAEQVARLLTVPFGRTQVHVEKGGNLQARARAVRYHALRTAAHAVGADRLAFGHHADDRAETFLLRLLRGAGPAGLAVLPPRTGDCIRPFLSARRADILAHLSRHGLPYAQDPSNQDVRFTRSRVRAQLLPLMTEMNPQIVEQLCAVADQLLGQQESPTRQELPSPQGIFSREVRTALQKLQRTRSPSMQIALAGGLALSYDRAHDQVVVVQQAWRRRSAHPPVSDVRSDGLPSQET